MQAKRSTAPGRVCLGQIAGAHGTAGEVRLKTFTAEPGDVAAYGPLEDEDGRRFEIVSLRPGKNDSIARLEGVGDRNAAEALKGTRLYVARAKLPEPDEEEWYHADLVGLEAVDLKGAPLGRVTAVQNFGAGDLLEIARQGGKGSLLVPFSKASVPEIDVQSGRIVIDPPGGLIED